MQVINGCNDSSKWDHVIAQSVWMKSCSWAVAKKMFAYVGTDYRRVRGYFVILHFIFQEFLYQNGGDREYFPPLFDWNSMLVEI